MNFLNKMLLYTISLYPLFGHLIMSIFNIHINKFTLSIFFPLIISTLIIRRKIHMPKYLKYFLLFVIYHLSISFYFDLIPKNTNFLFFFFSDTYVFAFFFILLIENLYFSKKFIQKFLKINLIVVLIATFVSIIQIFNPNFLAPQFLEGSILKNLFINRAPSIYSSININSIGFTFPIIIALLVSYYKLQKNNYVVFVLFFCFALVAALSQARYIIISLLIVLMYFIFDKNNFLNKKIYFFNLTVVTLIVAYIILNFLDVNYLSHLGDRFSNLNDDTSLNARFKSYYVFLQVFPQNFLFGVGPSTRDDVLYLLDGIPIIHIGHLSFLYFYGLFGSFLFYSFIFSLLKVCNNIKKKFNFSGLYIGILIFLVANFSLFYYNLGEPGFLALIIFTKFFNDKLSQHKSQIKSIK